MKRTPLARKMPLRRRPWRKALGTPEQRLAFKQAVLKADGYRCLMEGRSTCEGELQAAHIVPKQRLRRLGFGADVIYGVGSSASLCERHHRRHDAGYETLPYEFVPERCLLFVEALNLGYLLEQMA